MSCCTLSSLYSFMLNCKKRRKRRKMMATAAARETFRSLLFVSFSSCHFFLVFIRLQIEHDKQMMTAMMKPIHRRFFFQNNSVYVDSRFNAISVGTAKKIFTLLLPNIIRRSVSDNGNYVHIYIDRQIELTFPMCTLYMLQIIAS